MLTAIWDFLFHRHEWEIIRQGSLTSGGETFGFYHVLRCKKCGNLKSKDCF